MLFRGIACYIWAPYRFMIIQRTSNSWFHSLFVYTCGLWCGGLLFSLSSLHILKLEHTTYSLVITYISAKRPSGGIKMLDLSSGYYKLLDSLSLPSFPHSWSGTQSKC